MHAAVDVFMVLDNLPKAAMADRYIVIKLATANSDLNEAVETFTYHLWLSMSNIQHLDNVSR